jgi:mono/diheme cytochrome c family protein
MKKVLKALLYLVLALVVLGGAGFAYLTVRKPAVAPTSSIKIEATPERLARGKYVALAADCEGCHSQSDGTRFAFPKVEGGRFAGNEFTTAMGMPGLVVAANLTPDPETGIGAWTDGEKIRAIREGIDKDGNVLFPMMPYTHFREMSDEDVYSVVAYLDSLPPIKRAHPKTTIDFPVGLMIKGVPQPVTAPVASPNAGDPMAYGKYLATIGGCISCHSENLAGGEVFTFPPYKVVAANISPDLETGIGKWTEQHFYEKFTSYRDYAANGSPRVSRDNFTTMPWLTFAQLPDSDIRALYVYLHSRPAVKKAVETHPK